MSAFLALTVLLADEPGVTGDATLQVVDGANKQALIELLTRMDGFLASAGMAANRNATIATTLAATSGSVQIASADLAHDQSEVRRRVGRGPEAGRPDGAGCSSRVHRPLFRRRKHTGRRRLRRINGE